MPSTGPAARSPASISLVQPADVPVQAAVVGLHRRRSGTGAPPRASSAAGPTVPTMTRPLDAPRSTAATRARFDGIGSAQERGGDAGVDGDVQAGGVLRSPPVSANTALATCSGSTSRLRMVRWA